MYSTYHRYYRPVITCWSVHHSETYCFSITHVQWFDISNGNIIHQMTKMNKTSSNACKCYTLYGYIGIVKVLNILVRRENCCWRCFPSFPQGSACIVLIHSSVMAPSVCRKNGEALSRPLRGLKYAGLLQSPSKHWTLLSSGRPVSIQPGPHKEVRAELVGTQPGKGLKLAAMSHQKISLSTSWCLYIKKNNNN